MFGTTVHRLDEKFRSSEPRDHYTGCIDYRAVGRLRDGITGRREPRFGAGSLATEAPLLGKIIEPQDSLLAARDDMREFQQRGVER